MQAHGREEAGERDGPGDSCAETTAGCRHQVCQLEELEGQLLRLRADFDNYRRRSRREGAQLRQDGARQLAGDLLPVLDSVERALEQAGDGDPLRQGLELIARQLHEVLAGHGLQRLESLGQQFDPQLHEAVMVVEDPGCPAGQIVEEIQAGYTMGERLLRAARVGVAAGEPDQQEGEAEIT